MTLMPAIVAAELPRGSVSSFAVGGAPILDNAAPLDIYHNPALACSSTYALEGYGARFFEMSDFDIAAGAAMCRIQVFQLGVAVTQLIGLDYFYERSLLLAASMPLISQCRIGIAVEHLGIEFGEGYGKTSANSLSFGAVSRPMARLRLAASVSNINRPHFDRQDDELPLTAELAASYSASQMKVVLCHHLNSNHPDRFSIGQQTSINRNFDLLLGLETEPLEISGGFSLKLRGFSFEYAYCNNVYLGGTHRVGLRYSH